MDMTFQQYIDNPLGKKNAVFSQRDMFKALYTEKFNKVLLREAGKINYTLYVDKKKDRYVIHIKIPSETVKDFYYDAVILFYSNDPVAKSSPSLQEYYVKFFSNDPAFVFTYLRVFFKNDMFFEDLKPKSSKLALKRDPTEKNPYQIPGYSKILYFAFIYMKLKNLFIKSVFESQVNQYSAKELLKNVEHTDTKILARQEEGRRQAVQIAREKKKEHKPEPSTNRIVNKSGNIKAVKVVKPSRATVSSKMSKTSKVTKTSKKK